jgi:hypothetical protein
MVCVSIRKPLKRDRWRNGIKIRIQYEYTVLRSYRSLYEKLENPRIPDNQTNKNQPYLH